MKIKCMECGKEVSTEVPDGTLVRAWIECPECIEKEDIRVENSVVVVIGEVKLPGVWQNLIDSKFPDDLSGIEDGDKKVHGVDDPTSYYDDTRVALPVRLNNGDELTFYLCSGQSNYWSSFDIMRDGIPVYESEPMDSFPTDCMIVVNKESDNELMKDVEYRIKIVWT
jgi:hypothetical protein